GGVCSPAAGAARAHGCRYEAPAPVAAAGGCAVGRFPPGAAPGARWLALVAAGALVLGLRGLQTVRRRAAGSPCHGSAESAAASPPCSRRRRR
ncbi:MAG TPA: hypothetical protein VL242_07575, partial [Sorangium sp.]|nr:hypothetical protein [Sorangium sp.]